MTDPAARPDATGDEQPTHPGLPRWVKISAVVLACAVLALLLAMILIGGEHGAGRHGAQVG